MNAAAAPMSITARVASSAAYAPVVLVAVGVALLIATSKTRVSGKPSRCKCSIIRVSKPV
ncbi:MAG TPA: hypothetical protein VGT81_05975 [Casimicrobiaceae bacterium]|nr:hypothetical protein [Casimicrobiaceae bacterium]